MQVQNHIKIKPDVAIAPSTCYGQVISLNIFKNETKFYNRN